MLSNLFCKILRKKKGEYQGFPGASVVKNPPAMQEMKETWVPSWG